MKIQNLILDLGVVILDVNYDLTANAFKKLGVLNFDELYSKNNQEKLFDKLEKGQITEAQFHEIIRKHIPVTVSDEQIDDAWNAMLLEVHPDTFTLLEDLAKTKKLFLLSNTNTIHIKAFSKIIDRQYGFRKFEKLFEKTYYSCEIGMRKPDAEIFDYVVKQNQLDIRETLFIDDTARHVDGARKYGLSALHLHGGISLNKLIPQ